MQGGRSGSRGQNTTVLREVCRSCWTAMATTQMGFSCAMPTAVCRLCPPKLSTMSQRTRTRKASLQTQMMMPKEMSYAPSASAILKRASTGLSSKRVSMLFMPSACHRGSTDPIRAHAAVDLFETRRRALLMQA